MQFCLNVNLYKEGISHYISDICHVASPKVGWNTKFVKFCIFERRM